MANPLYKDTVTGTIGELLVQLRLLEYGVQAAPPIKDSGNDLVGIRDRTVRFIQVKTTAKSTMSITQKLKAKIFDLLVIVQFSSTTSPLNLDQSNIIILKKDDIMDLNSVKVSKYVRFRICEEVIDQLWP